jgi:pyruvate formate lyase activating enzyme
LIKEGQRGICWVRQNNQGTLYSLVYGKPIARHIDPIEKKPLFHFYPGSVSYSIATVGCNFSCLFCQNADISQSKESGIIFGEKVLPEEIVSSALKASCRSISYTYTEPTIFLEYALDIAQLASAQGLKNVLVSNGYMSPEALESLKPYLHAANVDLKAFREDFYKTQCKAKLAPVLESLKIMKRMGVWVEVTTLIIPTLNDSKEELTDLARFIAEELGVETPWHVSRFHPTYRLTNLSITPVKRLQKAWEIGKNQGLRYVYTGNIPGDQGEKTFCYQCGYQLLNRYGFSILKKNLKGDQCPQCQTPIDGMGWGS